MDNLKDCAAEHIFLFDDLMKCERKLSSTEMGSEDSIRAVECIIEIASNFGLNIFDAFDKVYEFCENSKK